MDTSTLESQDSTETEESAERHLIAVLRGLIRGARSARSHGLASHRGWPTCPQCHAVKLGLALVAALDAPDDGGGGEALPVAPVDESSGITVAA